MPNNRWTDKIKVPLFVLLVLLCGLAFADPSITAVATNGTFVDGDEVYLTGTGFGTKPNCPGDDCKPDYFWKGDCDISPTSLGINTSWGTTQQISTNTSPTPLMGSCSMVGENMSSNTQGIQSNIDYQNNVSGFHFWVVKTTSTNADGDNIKEFRCHDSGSTYTNFISLTHASYLDENWTFEYGDTTGLISSPSKFYNYIFPPTDARGEWVPFEIDMHVQSSIAAEDGFWRVQQTGYGIDASSTSMTFDIGSTLEYCDQQFMMWNISNATETINGNFQIGYVFIDSGTASGDWVSRVYVSTVSSFAGGVMYPQPYSAWTNTGITISRLTIPDSFSGQTLYVAVVDETDTPSALVELTSTEYGNVSLAVSP